jgi:hypothetical protein
MDVVTARDRIAHFCAQVDGIAQAVSGYRALPPKYPGIAITLGPIVIGYAGTEQHWLPAEIRGLLMTGIVNETERHVAQIDPLITSLVDAFHPGTRAAVLDIGTGDRADNCLIRAIEPSQEITYAGHQHYGAVVTWIVEFRRFAS